MKHKCSRQRSNHLGFLRLLPAIFTVLYLLISLSYQAQASDIVIVSEGDSKLQQEIIDSFQKKLPQHRYKLLDANSAIYKLVIINKPDLIVTLGYKAAHLVPKDIAPLLHTVISKNNLKNISLCQVIVCEHKPRQIAIQLDQPAARQINLIRLLLPKVKNVGALFGYFSFEQEKLLTKMAKGKPYNILTRMIKRKEDISSQMDALLENSGVLLALPDPIIYNRFTIPQILLTSYHRKIPVIGFSKSFTYAGALASVYSTSEQISQHISEVIALIFSDPNYRPTSNYPSYFDIAIQRNVARSLEIKIPTMTELKQSMIEMEK